MRDWLMILTPIVVAFYVATHPEHTLSMIDWAWGLLSR